MTRRPRRPPIGLLAAGLLALTQCVSDAPFKVEGPTAPESLADGWQVARPEQVGLDPALLDQVYRAFVSEDAFFNALSLLVVKDDRLVFEAYCRSPADRDHYSQIQSVTKSVTSLVLGIVRSEGYLTDLDQPVYALIPDEFPPDPAKQAITVRHLLTMTSGLAFSNDRFSLEIYSGRPADPAAYILRKPLMAAPGERFDYRDCDPHLLSYLIQRQTGRTEAEWAAARLFAPLGIREWYWATDPAGTTTGAHGLHLKPRDLAKLGQLVLDHGRWGEVQVVDSAWVAASTQQQIATPEQRPGRLYPYGFYWWILPERGAFSAWGHGGNFICVVPAKRMVLVMTSMPDADDEVVGTELDDFEDLVAPLLALP